MEELLSLQTVTLQHLQDTIWALRKTIEEYQEDRHASNECKLCDVDALYRQIKWAGLCSHCVHYWVNNKGCISDYTREDEYFTSVTTMKKLSTEIYNRKKENRIKILTTMLETCQEELKQRGELK